MARAAIEFDGTNGDEVKQFAGNGIVAGQSLTISTAKGTVSVKRGAWVLKGDGGVVVVKAQAVKVEGNEAPVEPPAPGEVPPVVDNTLPESPPTVETLPAEPTPPEASTKPGNKPSPK